MMWEEDQEFVPITARHVLFNKKDNKFYFVDEMELVEGNGPYDTLEQATTGLIEYAKTL